MFQYLNPEYNDKIMPVESNRVRQDNEKISFSFISNLLCDIMIMIP